MYREREAGRLRAGFWELHQKQKHLEEEDLMQRTLVVVRFHSGVVSYFTALSLLIRYKEDIEKILV